MSKQLKFKAKIKDVSLLRGALELMGFPAEGIVISEGEKLTHHGYRGSGGEVDVLIRRTTFKGYGDLGFKVGEEETEILVDSDDDAFKIAYWLGQQTGGAKIKGFSSSLPQWYSAYGSMNALESQGLHPECEVQEDGRLRVFAD